MIPVRFDEAARAALYRVMELRRDIRHFRPGDIDDDVLARILGAAELAPSVGFSQPWAFVVIRDPAIRAHIRQSFLRCREAEAARFPADRREAYLEFKLEGIEESTLNVCVLADLRPRDEAILGTTVQPESVRASVCCAVQNLWLAARAEGIGIGWVSIVEPSVLREELALPAGVEPIAYLCVGHAEEFRERPLLEENGWRPRRTSVIHRDRWPSSEPSAPAPTPPDVRGLPGAIPPYCEIARRASLEHQLLLTKPPGSLGRLEEVAAWYAGAHGRFPPPRPERPLVAVFAADHGVTVEGVSAYPSSVTAGMVANMMAGGAAISVMAHRLDIHVSLVDVGVAGDLSALPTNPLFALHRAPVRAGTANFAREPAMTREQARQAMDVGEQLARRAASDDYQLLAIGEVGIGNTTSAAALLCAFTGASPSDAVGAGTGISDAIRLHKVAIVEAALRLHAPDPADPLGVLAAVGGLELAAMAGFLLGAARERIPVVLDGFLASVSALVAAAFDPQVTPYLLASHASAEKGAGLATAALGKTPLLDLGLRLGEGTGAVLAVDLVRTAVELQLSMATFATAGIRR
ncbi:nicotinate-nucleotide--dimethylbenzimidazole phosphoribosyltransferase [Pendulispora brunnea]|uniref:Nicotinate-nucleotide--dimethylbenzimidazole phosphoribosyltransferase n=1 Tax=Pendulispora brunnea TaxID=2905690 RepID=A0ABZ2KC31_9BACT